MKLYKKLQNTMDYKSEIRKLKYLVDDHFNLEEHELDSRSKKGELAIARLIYGNLIMCELNLKPAQAPKYLNRDRSLFYYYIKQHEAFINDARIYPDYYNTYTSIKERYYDMSDAVMLAKTQEKKHRQLYDVECNIEKLERERKLLIDELC